MEKTFETIARKYLTGQLELGIEPQPEPILLRAYQQTIKDEVAIQLSEGITRILVYGPTGSGKTATFCSMIADFLNKGVQIMLLMHREFLIEQTIKTLMRFEIPRAAIGVIKAGYPENRARPLQLAGIQSLARRKHPDAIDVIFIDECHTCAFFAEYSRVCESFPDATKIGFSASPWRMKPHKEYFGLWFDTIVRGPSIRQLMTEGYLSRVRYFGKGGVVDLSQIDTDSSGDFNTAQMEQKFLAAGICEEVRDEVVKRCEGRTGVIFNAGVSQSKLQTQLLNEAGIITKHIDADTTVTQRRQMFTELASGEIDCISSVGCLTEGFDVPSIGYIVLARATKSKALYFQVSGRGLRISPGKENCFLLDFGGNVHRFGYLTKYQHITLDPAPLPDEEQMTKTCPIEDGGCGAEVWIFERICPECGYEFPPKDKPTDDFEAEFGELFDDETWKAVSYARGQRKMRFTRKLPPDGLWRTFKKRYSDKVLFTEWLFGATFGGNDSPFNRQAYMMYLDKHAPTNQRDSDLYKIWMRHHLQLEFGQPGRKHRTGKEKFSSSQLNLNWWDLLQVSPTATWQEIKANYTSLVRLYHPETTDFDEKTALAEARKLENALELAQLHVKGEAWLFDHIAYCELRPDDKQTFLLDNQGNPWNVKTRTEDMIFIARYGEHQQISRSMIPEHFHWPTAEDVLELLKKCRTSKQRQWFQERLEPETFETAQKILAGVQT